MSSKVAASFCIPNSNVWEFSLFHVLAGIWCHSVPDFGHSNRCVVVSVVTVASWPVYRFLRRKVRWSGILISENFPQFVVIHTVIGFGVVNKAEVDVFQELSCFFYDDTQNLKFSEAPEYPHLVVIGLLWWKMEERALSHMLIQICSY